MLLMYILCTSEGLSKFNEIIVSHKKEKSNKIKKNNSPKARVSQTRLNFRAKINSTKLPFLAQKFKLSWVDQGVPEISMRTSGQTNSGWGSIMYSIRIDSVLYFHYKQNWYLTSRISSRFSQCLCRRQILPQRTKVWKVDKCSSISKWFNIT